MNDMPLDATAAQNFVPQPFSTSRLKKRAKQCLSGKFGSVLGMLVLLQIALIGIFFACGLVELFINVAAVISLPVASMAQLLFCGASMMGPVTVCMAAVEGRAPDTSDAFLGFRDFGRCCVAGLLKTLFVFLWGLLLVIPGIIKCFSYSATFFLLRRYPHLSANQAIAESRRIMDGHKGEAFLLLLSFIGWFLLSILTFGLLFLYVTPYMGTTFACFYDELIEADAARHPEQACACPPPLP